MQGHAVPRGRPRDVGSRVPDREPDGLILGSSPRMTEVEWWWGGALRPGGEVRSTQSGPSKRLLAVGARAGPGLVRLPLRFRSGGAGAWPG